MLATVCFNPIPAAAQETDKVEVQETHELGTYADGKEPLAQPLAADNCRTYWPTSYQVCGAIREKYESMATTWIGQNPFSFLGLPPRQRAQQTRQSR